MIEIDVKFKDGSTATINCTPKRYKFSKTCDKFVNEWIDEHLINVESWEESSQYEEILSDCRMDEILSDWKQNGLLAELLK